MRHVSFCGPGDAFVHLPARAQRPIASGDVPGVVFDGLATPLGARLACLAGDSGERTVAEAAAALRLLGDDDPLLDRPLAVAETASQPTPEMLDDDAF